MPERYRRAEDALADLIRENRRGTRDSQRATGTEKALTTLVAEQAASDALEAIAAAATADTLAKGAVTFSTNVPTAGDAAGKPIGALWTVLSSNAIESYWELTALGWIKRPLSTTVIPQINIGTGTFGTLAGARLAANAIDGMTITGALIRTAASGQRLELDVAGLTAFNGTGNVVARLSSQSGSMNVRAAAVGSEERAQIWLTANPNNGIGGGLAQVRADAAYQASAIGASALINAQSGAGALDLTSGRVNGSSGNDARLLVTAKSGGAGNAAGNAVYIEAEPAGIPIIIGDRYNTGRIRLNGEVEYGSDIDWQSISFATGWLNNGGVTSRWRIKQGQLQISGRIARSSGGIIGTSYAQFSNANTTLAAIAAALPNPIAITPGTDVTQQGLLRINTDGSLSCAGGGTVFQPIATFLI